MRSDSDRVALSFLAVTPQDFEYAVYRRELLDSEPSVPNTYYLPRTLRDDRVAGEQARYAVAFEQRDGFEKCPIFAWSNPSLTTRVLHDALARRVALDDLRDDTEIEPDSFTREVAFVIRRHGDAREVMWLRAYDVRSVGRFGFLCSFALRIPRDSTVSSRL